MRRYQKQSPTPVSLISFTKLVIVNCNLKPKIDKIWTGEWPLDQIIQVLNFLSLAHIYHEITYLVSVLLQIIVWYNSQLVR